MGSPALTGQYWPRLVDAVRRHPYRSIFVLALLVRGLVAAVIYWRYNGTLFLDDATYSDIAASKARGEDDDWDAYTDFLFERTATMLVPLTLLYEIFGPVRLVGQLFVATAGALACSAAAAVAAQASRPAMWFAGLGTALMPSQVIFSSTTMKDAFVWLLLAVGALLVAKLRDTTRLLPVPALLFGVLVLIGFLRLHTQVAACLAVLTALVLIRPRSRPKSLLAAAAAAAILAPAVAGIGLAGNELLRNGADASYLSGLRQAQAVGGSALDVDGGSGSEPGNGGDDQEPAAPTPSSTISGDDAGAATLSYLPRGIVAVLLGPFPGGGGSSIYQLAGLENLLWYALLALVLLGLPEIWRRRSMTAFPVLVAGGCLVMWALVEGNAGTAFRHRGEFVWAVWILASLGAVRCLDRWRGRRQAQDTAPEAADEPSLVASRTS